MSAVRLFVLRSLRDSFDVLRTIGNVFSRIECTDFEATVIRMIYWLKEIQRKDWKLIWNFMYVEFCGIEKSHRFFYTLKIVDWRKYFKEHGIWHPSRDIILSIIFESSESKLHSFKFISVSDHQKWNGINGLPNSWCHRRSHETFFSHATSIPCMKYKDASFETYFIIICVTLKIHSLYQIRIMNDSF